MKNTMKALSKQLFGARYESIRKSLLPLLFGGFQGLNLFPIGLAVLCLNTPICTLLSSDPDLEQALRMLPGQAGRFCRKYGLFIFAVNGIVAGVYLCS